MTYAPNMAIIATPVGMIRLDGDVDCLHRITVSCETSAPCPADTPALRAAAEQLTAWFSGRLRTFDLPLAPAAHARGQQLREGLIAVCYGETISYGALARRLDSGPRAIGQLCARNPFPIVVPCHRVSGHDGSLNHYSAGNGIVTKQWLLDFERRNLEQNP
jgi:methylated-DNA-[protein]-cysteine S-methyltransferase